MAPRSPPTSRGGFSGLLERIFRRNVALKLVSVTLALSFWAWVKAEQIVERKGRVQVDYRFPQDTAPVDPGPRTVNVTISGALGKMANLDWDTLSILVDASDAATGNLSIDFSDRNLDGLASSLQVERISPPALDLQLDPLMTRSTYVEPIVVGEPANGYYAEDPIVTPSTIEITGPQTRLQELVQLSTDVIDISGATIDHKLDIELIIGSRSIRAETRRVEVIVPILPIIEERRLTSIPIEIPSTDWTSTSASMSSTWRGPVLALEALESKDMVVVVHPPKELPSVGAIVELGLVQSPDEVGYTVLHPLDTEEIELLTTDPQIIRLVYSPSTPADTEEALSPASP